MPEQPPSDPFADLPLTEALSISQNPLLATATEEQLAALVQRLRMLVNQPTTLKASIVASGGNSRTTKRRAILDSI